VRSSAAAPTAATVVPQTKASKHKDPYASATGQTLDDIVRQIEGSPDAASVKKKKATPKVQPQPSSHVVGNANEVTTSGTADAGHDHNQERDHGASGQAVRQQQRRRNKKRQQAKQQVPVKTGMTKAQRREEYIKKREAAKGRPIPLPHNVGDEDEDAAPAEDNEDYSDTQNERAKEYRKGGYHPVVIGDVYNERYRVIKKLGWGYFSTVWLVWDYDTNTYQAMKIQKAADHYREAAFDEIRLLSEIMSADPHRDRCCARMNDYFEHVGPNGTHVCMVFDVLGENLLTLIEWYEYRGIPLPIVKAIAQQVLIGLEHIHSIDILHTDLKPENVLLSTPKHKIISTMRRYRPPPLSTRPALVSKDVKHMTRSQKRRYYNKLKKVGVQNASTLMDEIMRDGLGQAHEADGESQVATDSAGDAVTADIPAEEDGPTHAPTSGQDVDEFGVPREDCESDTDPEWEIERFHHVCLADFGNSCWTYKHFTDEVQTRQYRSPEVILGDDYSTPIDLWSAACMFFELITGEFLFDPKQADNYSRDEDHLALMSELLGELPEHMRLGNGKYRSRFYNSRGELRNIKQLNFWELPDILHQKYRFTKKKANEISEFLLPMLELDPNRRATAAEMLNNFQHFFEVQDDDYGPLCFDSRKEEAAAAKDADLRSDEEDEDEGADADDDVDIPVVHYAREKHRHDDDGTERSREGSVEKKDGDGDDSEGSDRFSDMDAETLKQWWQQHPLLNEVALAKRGLTIHDVQMALANRTLDTVAKQESVLVLLTELEQLELGNEDASEQS